MTAEFTVTENATEVLQRFTAKDWYGIERRSMRKGMNIVKNEGRKRFKRSLPKATHKNPKYSDRLVDAITGKVYVGGTTTYFEVHNAGSRKSTSGTFRARFFEKGTKPRVKGHYRGRIENKYSYMRGLDSVVPKAMQKVDEQMDKEIEKALIKKSYV
jgi:hypothetical protein